MGLTISPNGAAREQPFSMTVTITPCACEATAPLGLIYHQITINDVTVLYGSGLSVSLSFHDCCCYSSAGGGGAIPQTICSCDGIYIVKARCGCIDEITHQTYGQEAAAMEIFVTNHVVDCGYCVPEPPGPNPEPCASIQ